MLSKDFKRILLTTFISSTAIYYTNKWFAANKQSLKKTEKLNKNECAN